MNDSDEDAARAALVDDIVLQLNQLKQLIRELEQTARVHEKKPIRRIKSQLQ
jgi:hypothetical protein